MGHLLSTRPPPICGGRALGPTKLCTRLANNIFCHHVRVGLVGGQINFELYLFRPDSLEHWNNLAGTTLGFKRAPRAKIVAFSEGRTTQDSWDGGIDQRLLNF